MIINWIDKKTRFGGLQIQWITRTPDWAKEDYIKDMDK